jgi:hypothetical protein
VERHQEDDFGAFATDPGAFSPATVRFCVLRVEGNLEDLAKAVYDSARA